MRSHVRKFTGWKISRNGGKKVDFNRKNRPFLLPGFSSENGCFGTIFLWVKTLLVTIDR
jgi:hypothetical protein